MSNAEWKSAAESQNRQLAQKCTELTEVRAQAERAEARIAELERELDAAQAHIHAGDECITSLHDDLARVADIVREWSDVGASYEAMRAIQKAVGAYVYVRKGEQPVLARVTDLVRKAHGHWDAIRWPEDKRYIAMLAEAIELLTVRVGAVREASAPAGTLLTELDEAIRLEDACEDGPNEQTLETLRLWRELAEELVRERDEALANYKFMVEREGSLPPRDGGAS